MSSVSNISSNFCIVNTLSLAEGFMLKLCLSKTAWQLSYASRNKGEKGDVLFFRKLLLIFEYTRFFRNEGDQQKLTIGMKNHPSHQMWFCDRDFDMAPTYTFTSLKVFFYSNMFDAMKKLVNENIVISFAIIISTRKLCILIFVIQVEMILYHHQSLSAHNVNAYSISSLSRPAAITWSFYSYICVVT